MPKLYSLYQVVVPELFKWLSFCTACIFCCYPALFDIIMDFFSNNFQIDKNVRHIEAYQL